MSGKVWLVSSGAYSDYGIDRVFSTKEAADEYVRIQNDRSTWAFDKPKPYGADCRVEEYDLDAPLEERLGAWEAVVFDAGGGYSVWSDNATPDKPAYVVEEKTSLSARRFVGYGETREHARRSAEELRRVTLTEPFLARQ